MAQVKTPIACRVFGPAPPPRGDPEGDPTGGRDHKTTAIDEICSCLEEILAGQKQNHYEDINAAPVTETNRVVTTGGHFAYLKIAEGCDKHCTYCIIPKGEGNYRSDTFGINGSGCLAQNYAFIGFYRFWLQASLLTYINKYQILLSPSFNSLMNFILLSKPFCQSISTPLM